MASNSHKPVICWPFCWIVLFKPTTTKKISLTNTLQYYEHPSWYGTRIQTCKTCMNYIWSMMALLNRFIWKHSGDWLRYGLGQEHVQYASVVMKRQSYSRITNPLSPQSKARVDRYCWFVSHDHIIFQFIPLSWKSPCQLSKVHKRYSHYSSWRLPRS